MIPKVRAVARLLVARGNRRGLRTALHLLLRGVPAKVIREAGPGFGCGPGAFFRPGESIHIGARVFMGRHVHVAAPLTIGSDVMIASDVAFVGGDHCFSEVGVVIKESGRSTPRPIIIEDDVWIGHGVIILEGVRIGFGAVVGAGSVVTRDVAPCSVVAGNPARKIRDRFASPTAFHTHRAMLRTRYER